MAARRLPARSGVIVNCAAPTGPPLRRDGRRDVTPAPPSGIARTPVAPTRRRIVRGAPAGIALALAGCAGTPPIAPPPGAEPLPPPSLRPGDRWYYQRVNLYNGASEGAAVAQVLTTAPELRVALQLPGREQPLIERYVDAWTVLDDAGWDHPVRFESPMPVVPPGARAGQRLSTHATYRSEASSERLDWRQRLQVTGWERIRVPAGSFDALRIERLIHFRHPDPFRFDPNREDVIWYAPAVGRWVLREWTGDYMSGGPTPRGSRTLEERTRWLLTAWEPASR